MRGRYTVDNKTEYYYLSRASASHEVFVYLNVGYHENYVENLLINVSVVK